jgi:tetratricopeptide (TPR) repeat protein
MTNPFLSSEEFDERAHALYNEAKYDEALDLLREGLALYPNAVELHVGVGYARLAREEFAWARRSFEEALVLDPEHEDSLAGLGEVLLKFGLVDQGMKAFDRTIALGYADDVDLMLQIGRALFREGFVEQALTFFERGAQHASESAEAQACIGYALHRMGRDGEASVALQQALVLDPSFAEARVYLANLMYDAGQRDEALVEFERTSPEDHWDELGIWRLMELKKGAHALLDEDEQLKPWEERLTELVGEPDAIDELLAEVEQRVLEQTVASAVASKGHLEALGGLLTGLAQQQEPEATQTDLLASDAPHRVELQDGRTIEGTWDEIVQTLRDARDMAQPVEEYMARESRMHYGATGVRIATHGAEAFIRGSAEAGLLRIVR